MLKGQWLKVKTLHKAKTEKHHIITDRRT